MIKYHKCCIITQIQMLYMLLHHQRVLNCLAFHNTKFTASLTM